MKILSVDDSAATRLFIKQAVLVLGCTFNEAENGRAAFELLETQARNNELPDLILLDLHMPVMGGMELLSRLKEDDRFKHISITMVTTELERESIVSAIDLGAVNYLVKPFAQEELIAKIMESLGMGL